MFRHARAWLLLCTVVPCLGAPTRQDPAHPAPAAPLSSSRPRDGTWTFNMRRQAADSSSAPFGTMTVTQTAIDTGGRAVIRRVIVYDYGPRGQVVDTTLSLAANLAPISERTYKPSGVIHLDFSGRFVTGVMGPVATPRRISDTLSTPAFNSTDLDLVVRSLALHEGMETQLAIYDPELGGYRQALVRVEGVDQVDAPTGKRAAWRVRIRDRRVESIYRVDRETRALLANHVTVPEQRAEYDIVAVRAPGRPNGDDFPTTPTSLQR